MPCARVSMPPRRPSTARRRLIADEARIGIQSAIGPIVTDHREADPRRGFGSLGEFMQAVYQADKPGQSPDSRLLIGGIGAAAPSNYSNEASGQDGGFLVPPQFSRKKSSSSPWAKTRSCRLPTTSRSAATAWPFRRTRRRPGAPTASGPTGREKRPRPSHQAGARSRHPAPEETDGAGSHHRRTAWTTPTR
jgi:hypothetical protein